MPSICRFARPWCKYNKFLCMLIPKIIVNLRHDSQIDSDNEIFDTVFLHFFAAFLRMFGY